MEAESTSLQSLTRLQTYLCRNPPVIWYCTWFFNVNKCYRILLWYLDSIFNKNSLLKASLVVLNASQVEFILFFILLVCRQPQFLITTMTWKLFSASLWLCSDVWNWLKSSVAAADTTEALRLFNASGLWPFSFLIAAKKPHKCYRKLLLLSRLAVSSSVSAQVPKCLPDSKYQVVYLWTLLLLDQMHEPQTVL